MKITVISRHVLSLSEHETVKYFLHPIFCRFRVSDASASKISPGTKKLASVNLSATRPVRLQTERAQNQTLANVFWASQVLRARTAVLATDTANAAVACTTPVKNASTIQWGRTVIIVRGSTTEMQATRPQRHALNVVNCVMVKAIIVYPETSMNRSSSI